MFMSRVLRKINFLSRIFKKPKQRTKIWLIVLTVFIATFFAANLDYPKTWNKFVGFINPELESINLPSSLTKADKWGVFRFIDSKLRVPKFSEKEYSLGLDLRGGVHLVYEADLANVSVSDYEEAMGSLRDAIERRVNFLGVAEPIVQVQQAPNEGYRLIVELAGIEDPKTAIEQIGKTPFLEFKETRPPNEQIAILKKVSSDIDDASSIQFCQSPQPLAIAGIQQLAGEDPCFKSTGLTGQYLEKSGVVSHPQTGAIQISLQFNGEGSKLFETITERNIGSVIAIYLDSMPISIPRVNEKISGGQATITGSFNIEEARDLSRNLNAGALPVPVKLIGQQRVGASLGQEALNKSLRSAFIALIAIIIFLIIIYRFSGVLAVVSLGVYIALFLTVIKLVPITLTLSGIAGLIFSLGIAVDANVLVFERLREEFEYGKEDLNLAVQKAFSRAWPSIRDGNISTLLTAIILFWFSTSFVQGFALVLAVGIIISIFCSMIFTKYLMKLFIIKKLERIRFIWTR